jgi:hypothetical protein
MTSTKSIRGYVLGAKQGANVITGIMTAFRERKFPGK